MTTTEASEREAKAWQELKQVPTQPARPTVTGMLDWRRVHMSKLDAWVQAHEQKIQTELAESKKS